MLDTVKITASTASTSPRSAKSSKRSKATPKKAKVGFDVTTRWNGQTRSETIVDGYTMGGERIARSHKIVADEPCELLGGDSAPNPQELLMAAFNACITVGYVAGASVKGITLDSLEIRTRGELDLRGFLGLSDAGRSGLRSDRLRGPDQGRRHSRAVRGDPPDRDEDLAQLLQHQPADPPRTGRSASADRASRARSNHPPRLGAPGTTHHELPS